mmetsp:Transcript_14438/g.31822  ORF Transcript_14438/g.31822 Transcript_14438/m.31822 type:complete len:207 (+) Transcript_14438:896-1516(+)
MKMIEGLDSLAISNICFTSFSLSPCHLDTKSELLIAKKVLSASVATALARKDLPVPGGPYSRIPFQGLRLPVNSCGKRVGRMTASFSASLAISSPATSSHFTFGFSEIILLDNAPRIFAFSSSSFPSLFFGSFLSNVFAPPPLLGGGPPVVSSTDFISSARFIYPSTLSMMVLRVMGFCSYFKAVMNKSSARLYEPRAFSYSPRLS